MGGFQQGGGRALSIAYESRTDYGCFFNHSPVMILVFPCRLGIDCYLLASVSQPFPEPSYVSHVVSLFSKNLTFGGKEKTPLPLAAWKKQPPLHCKWRVASGRVQTDGSVRPSASLTVTLSLSRTQ